MGFLASAPRVTRLASCTASAHECDCRVTWRCTQPRRHPAASPLPQPPAAFRPAHVAVSNVARRCAGIQCSTRSRSSSSSDNGSSEGSVGVVIVDHGSRKSESNDMLFEFAELYKKVTGRQLVEVAHMELAEPTIEQAVGRCAAAGAHLIIIAPYFLSRGRHIQQDIPALAAAAAAAHPTVECVLAEPIGIDALMAQLIENRVQAAEVGGASAIQPQTAAAAESAAAP